MPADPGMAFVVITHIGEGHESALRRQIGNKPLRERDSEQVQILADELNIGWTCSLG